MINPNIHFLLLMVFALKDTKGITHFEAVSMIIAEVISGKVTETKGVSMKLVKNFFDGYKQAINKYGEEEAAVRMLNKLYEVLSKEFGMSPEDLAINVDKSLGIMSLFTNGIHLTKDSEGNYTN